MYDIIEANKINIVNEKDIIQIFIETDRDVFSKKVLFVLVGNVSKEHYEFFTQLTKTKLNLTEEDRNALIASLHKGKKYFYTKFLETLSEASTFFTEKITIKALEIVIEVIDGLRLDDRWWQKDPTRISKKEAKTSTTEEFIKVAIDWVEKAIEKLLSLSDGLSNKYLKKWKGFLANIVNQIGDKIHSFTKKIELFKAWLQKKLHNQKNIQLTDIAAICGFWNGLVDMVTGLLFIVKVAIQGGVALQNGIVKKNTSNNTYQRLLEEIDNMYIGIGKLDWQIIMDKIDEKITKMSVLMKVFEAAINGIVQKAKELKNITIEEWHYFLAYGATLFIPVSLVANILGKAGKVGKMMGKLLVWIDNMVGRVFGVAINKGKAAIDVIITWLKAIGKKIQEGSKKVAEMIDEVITSFLEWLEKLVGKISEKGILLYENATIKVEKVYNKVDQLMTYLYLITYKKTGHTIYCNAMPEAIMLSLFKDLLTWNVRKNIRALAEEGIELLKNNSSYYLKYKEEIIPLGGLRDTAQALNALFDKSTSTKAKKALDDLAEMIKKRRTVLERWASKFDQSFVNHLSGDIKAI